MALFNLAEVNEVKNLPLLARQVVEGFIVGLHKSPFHGFSVEFAEHRVYNPGESTKNIDWKVFARTDKLYTKRYEEETNLRCQIVIDTSSSMYYPSEGAQANKMKFSVLCAAGLTELLRKQRDAVGLSLFSDEVEQHLKPKTNAQHVSRMYHLMEEQIACKDLNKTSEPAKCLHEIAEQVHKRSLVIIFSDMMQAGGNQEMFDALRHLKHNKHEVVLFHVTDRKHEIEFEFENRPYQFVDMETGREIKLHANQVKEAYSEKMRTFEKDLKEKCVQYQIDFVTADINEGFSQVLTPYLLKRTKMM